MAILTVATDTQTVHQAAAAAAEIEINKTEKRTAVKL